MSEEELLEQLINDPSFHNIQELINEEVDIMSILRVSHKELQHSNFLAWIFNPKESHLMGNYFVKEFMRICVTRGEYLNMSQLKDIYSKSDLSDLEIKREHEHIDIFMLSESDEFCLVIENKIFARERNGQLNKYRNYVEDEYPNNCKIYVYLSLFEQEITKIESEYYIQLTYRHIKEILVSVFENKNIFVPNNTKDILNQYLKNLNSLMNENENIERKARDLYKKYKSSFDLIFKYTSPYCAPQVPNNLIELIEKEPHMRIFKSSKSYVRFQPEYLYENIEILREKGFISNDDDLSGSWLFLFEFNIRKDYINFDFKIGPYGDHMYRKRLYDFCQKNDKIFNRINYRKKISPSYHLAFQKKIITKKDYNKFLESGSSSFNNKIEEGFISLMDELKIIMSVLNKELKG